MYESDDRMPADLVEALGLGQISDEAALEALCAEAVAAHPGEVAEARAGNKRKVGFLVGQVMRASGGRADPRRVNTLVARLVGQRPSQ